MYKRASESKVSWHIEGKRSEGPIEAESRVFSLNLSIFYLPLAEPRYNLCKNLLIQVSMLPTLVERNCYVQHMKA